MKKTIIKSIFVFLPILSFSCINYGNQLKVEGSSKIEKVSIEKTFVDKAKNLGSVKISIKNLGFKTKLYSDAVLPKAFADVKSYKIFLTSNYADPLNNIVLGSMNWVDSKTNNQVITIANVPNGSNYFGVVSAYDDVSNSLTALNITEPDTTIMGLDQKWARSTNSVNISGDISVYSDGSTSLSIALPLKHGVPASADTNISVLAGDPTSTATEQIN